MANLPGSRRPLIGDIIYLPVEGVGASVVAVENTITIRTIYSGI